jgi:hypothetical protein
LLTDQPFVWGDTNVYELTLDKSPVFATISFNRPWSDAMVEMFRNPANGSYMNLYSFGAGESEIQVKHLPNFDWQQLRLQIYGGGAGEFYFLCGNFIELPAAVTMPPLTFTIGYNPTAQRLEGLNYSGDADGFFSHWKMSDESGMDWLLYQDPNVADRSLPAIPDSLITEFEIQLDQFMPQAAILMDFDTVYGYRDFTNQWLEAGVYENIPCSRWNYIGKNITQGSADADPSPLLMESWLQNR